MVVVDNARLEMTWSGSLDNFSPPRSSDGVGAMNLELMMSPIFEWADAG